MSQVHHIGGREHAPDPARFADGGLAEVEQLADRLSAMVERIGASVARLKVDTAISADPLVMTGNAGPVRAIDEILRMRARRQAIFGNGVSDAAWDILLFAYWAHLHQQRISIGNICDGAGVPLSTGLRWIERLCYVGLVSVRPDPLDQRRKFVEISPHGSDCLSRYLSESPAAACAA